MFHLIRRAFEAFIDSIGVLLGIPRYLDKGVNSELLRAAEEAQQTYGHSSR